MEVARDGEVLVVSGSLDVRCSMELRTAVYDHLAAHDHVVVDLAGVDCVDLVALRVLALASRQAARARQRLTLRHCGPAVRRMLHLTHLIRVVDVDRAATAS